MGEQVVHLLQWDLLGLGKECPEEERVGEVTDNKEDVVFPANRLHGNGRHLSNHSVKGERHHGSQGDTFCTRACVENLSGDNPAERTTSG